MQKRKLADFLFEVAALKRLKRTGWQILGANEESIADHSFMVAMISFSLVQDKVVNMGKVLLMALFHDVEEARTGDIYKLADLYVRVDKKSAVRDSFSNLPGSVKIESLMEEYEAGKTPEAKIVHDADTLALVLELKQLIENGNMNAREWFEANLERLKLPESRKLGEEIKRGNSQDWWKKEREIIHRNYKK